MTLTDAQKRQILYWCIENKFLYVYKGIDLIESKRRFGQIYNTSNTKFIPPYRKYDPTSNFHVFKEKIGKLREVKFSPSGNVNRILIGNKRSKSFTLNTFLEEVQPLLKPEQDKYGLLNVNLAKNYYDYEKERMVCVHTKLSDTYSTK